MLGWRSRREGADQANPNLKQTGANCWEAQLFINWRHSGEEEQMCVCVCVSVHWCLNYCQGGLFSCLQSRTYSRGVNSIGELLKCLSVRVFDKGFGARRKKISVEIPLSIISRPKEPWFRIKNHAVIV